MALRPISFDVPQPRPSPIEEAFRLALTTALTGVVSEPFEKRRERRAAESTLALQERLTRLRSRLSVQEQLQGPEFTELTPALTERLRAAGVTPEDISETSEELPGRIFVPTRVAVEAGQAIRPVPTEQRNLLDFAYGVVQDVQRRRGGVVAPPLPAEVTAQRAEQIESSIPEALQAAGLLEERDRTSIQRQSLEDARLAGLIGSVTADDLTTFGGYILDGQPLSISDIVAVKNVARLEPIRDRPEVRDLYTRGKAVELAIQEGRAVRVPFNGETFTTMIQGMKQLNQENALALQGIGVEMARLGVMWRIDGNRRKPIDIGNREQTAAFLRSNDDLLQAITALRLGARGMQDIVNLEKVPGGVRLTPRALGYLQVIFQNLGRTDWKYPGLSIPAPQEIPQDRLPLLMQQQGTAGDVQQGTSSVYTPLQPPMAAEGTAVTGGRAGPSESALRVGPTRPAGAAAPSITIPAGRSPEYGRLYSGFYQRLTQDPALADRMFQRIMDVHVNADSAASFYRKAGLPDESLAGISTGTPRERLLTLNRLRRDALAALQDAREAALTRE